MHEPHPIRFPSAIIVPTSDALDVLATVETIGDHLTGIGELAAAFDLDQAATILRARLLEQ